MACIWLEWKSISKPDWMHVASLSTIRTLRAHAVAAVVFQPSKFCVSRIIKVDFQGSSAAPRKSTLLLGFSASYYIKNKTKRQPSDKATVDLIYTVVTMDHTPPTHQPKTLHIRALTFFNKKHLQINQKKG